MEKRPRDIHAESARRIAERRAAGVDFSLVAKRRSQVMLSSLPADHPLIRQKKAIIEARMRNQQRDEGDPSPC